MGTRDLLFCKGNSWDGMGVRELITLFFRLKVAALQSLRRRGVFSNRHSSQIFDDVWLHETFFFFFSKEV